MQIVNIFQFYVHEIARCERSCTHVRFSSPTCATAVQDHVVKMRSNELRSSCCCNGDKNNPQLRSAMQIRKCTLPSSRLFDASRCGNLLLQQFQAIDYMRKLWWLKNPMLNDSDGFYVCMEKVYEVLSKFWGLFLLFHFRSSFTYDWDRRRFFALLKFSLFSNFSTEKATVVEKSWYVLLFSYS